MILLQNSKLINIDEDSTNTHKIIAIKTLDVLMEEKHSQFYVKDTEYTLSYIEDYGKGTNIFRCTKSPFSDDSNLGNGNGVFRTKGEAIHRMQQDGYTVYQGDMIISKL